jgi:hypothetical protein
MSSPVLPPGRTFTVYYMNGTRVDKPSVVFEYDSVFKNFWTKRGLLRGGLRGVDADDDDLIIIDEMQYININLYGLWLDMMHIDARRIYMAMKSTSLVPRHKVGVVRVFLLYKRAQ